LGRETHAATLYSVDPPRIRTMKQQIRFGSEAPRRRTHSRHGMQAMRLLGHRHLGLIACRQSLKLSIRLPT